MAFKANARVTHETLKKTLTLDKNVFKVCEIKMKEIGRLRKKLIFAHFDGRKWSLLETNPDLSHVRYFRFG